MGKHKSKADYYLRQLKSLQHQQQAFHSELDDQLRLLDDQMFNLIQGQQFYQQSMVALTLMECTPESWLTGSQVVEQRLRCYGDEVVNQVEEIRQWAKKQMKATL